MATSSIKLEELIWDLLVLEITSEVGAPTPASNYFCH
jgi:hypothetical protein